MNLIELKEIYGEKQQYSKNTTDIDSIVVISDKLLQIRKMLKEVE